MKRFPGWHAILMLGFLLGLVPTGAHAFTPLLPQPKRMQMLQGELALGTIRIEAPEELAGESGWLERQLPAYGMALGDDGVPVRLELGMVDLPPLESRHAEAIRQQAYHLTVGPEGVRVTGASAQGVRYGLLTLLQLVGEEAIVSHWDILDWPDLAMRMLMVDPARQNENMDYYRRFIDFAGRHKINAILLHLTDDQTSALYHEDYPELMHEHAWRPDEVRALVAYAAERHIDLIPEIESLGHSRMFERLPDHADYLHQTNKDRPDQSFMGTDLPGLTNVLCPASPKAREYLAKMFSRSAELFPHPWLHIGFDEVDMSRCDRCVGEFGEQTHVEWLTTAFHTVHRIARDRGRHTAMWGDMLLAHPEVINMISPSTTVIFDWHYRPEVSAKSAEFFNDLGFDVIATPALVAAPHMVLPDRRNYDNIVRFTQIARDLDLPGVNTTIWVPTRYMSDALWPGIAFAASQAWSGSDWNEEAFTASFLVHQHHSGLVEEFHEAWTRLAAIRWHRPDFNAGCWMDEASLKAAREIDDERRAAVQAMVDELTAIRALLATVGESVQRNRTEWLAYERSAAILQYSMEHLLAARDLTPEALRALDARCAELIGYIVEDWDRNRFADDPGKDGRFLQVQHLLYRFKQMHAFHQHLLAAEAEAPGE